MSLISNWRQELAETAMQKLVARILTPAPIPGYYVLQGPEERISETELKQVINELAWLSANPSMTREDYLTQRAERELPRREAPRRH